MGVVFSAVLLAAMAAIWVLSAVKIWHNLKGFRPKLEWWNSIRLLVWAAIVAFAVWMGPVGWLMSIYWRGRWTPSKNVPGAWPTPADQTR